MIALQNKILNGQEKQSLITSCVLNWHAYQIITCASGVQLYCRLPAPLGPQHFFMITPQNTILNRQEKQSLITSFFTKILPP